MSKEGRGQYYKRLAAFNIGQARGGLGIDKVWPRADTIQCSYLETSNLMPRFTLF